jgi:hypothetical protein
MPDPSFFIPLFLQSAVLPFGIAFALLLALRKPAPALAAGFLASYFAVFHAQWSPLPHQALDWMPWIALFGAAGVLATERASFGLRIVLRLVLAAAMALVVVLPALASLGMAKAALIAAAAAALVFLAWSWLAHAAQIRPTPAPLMMIVAGGSALAMMLDASQAIGQLSGALAAALAACVVLGLSRLRIALDGAAVGFAVLLLGALLTNAYLYAGFSFGNVALLAGGLLADPLVAGIQGLRGREGGTGAWVGSVALAVVPVAAALVLVFKAAQESGGY